MKKRLFDALHACRAALEFTANKDFAEYERDLMLRSAVERQLEILGEALGQALRIDPDLGEDIPALLKIIGLRNRIIHGYDSVDDEIVWDVVQTKLSDLEQQLLRRLGD